MRKGYFLHEMHAHSDPRIQRLMSAYGAAGIGVYWGIVENLYANDGKLPIKAYEGISYTFHVDKAMVRSIITDFDLFRIDEESFCAFEDARIHRKRT